MAEKETTYEWTGGSEGEGLPWPTPGSPPDGSAQIKKLAEETDAALEDNADALGTHEAGPNGSTGIHVPTNSGGAAAVADWALSFNPGEPNKPVWQPITNYYLKKSGGNLNGVYYFNNTYWDPHALKVYGYGFNFPGVHAVGTHALHWVHPNCYQVVDGTAVIQTGSASDGRMKTNIEDYPSDKGLEFIESLRVREYSPIDVLAEGYDPEAPEPFTDEGKRLVGLVRQEVPEEIRYDPPEERNAEGKEQYGTVRYLDCVSYLISAVQELSQQNKELQQRVADLEADDA